MKTAFEAFVSIFIITICVFVCAGIIAADVKAAGARDAYSTYCSQLQDSNFSEVVVNECMRDAENRGFSLQISVYSDDNGNRSADVVLGYDFSIGIIGVLRDQTIRGHVS